MPVRNQWQLSLAYGYISTSELHKLLTWAFERLFECSLNTIIIFSGTTFLCLLDESTLVHSFGWGVQMDSRIQWNFLSEFIETNFFDTVTGVA